MFSVIKYPMAMASIAITIRRMITASIIVQIYDIIFSCARGGGIIIEILSPPFQ
jgi:hypothetical protein